MTHIRWRILIPGALLAVAAGGCTASTEARKTEGKRPAVTVRTITPERTTIARQVDISGTVISPDQATVSSQVAGVVREAAIELGQEVQPGQVLARLDPQELEFALHRSESLLKQTEAQLNIDGVTVKEPPPNDQIAAVRLAQAQRDDSRAQLERAIRLSKQGLLAQADMDTAQTRLKVDEARYQAAIEDVQSLKASLQDRRAAYALAQKKLADATIRAPVGGRISERLVHPGEYIRENTPVVTIVQMNPLKLRTALQERQAGVIRPGLTVHFRVEAFPEDLFQGKVAFVSPAIDQATRTFTIEAIIDNPQWKLKPGFFAKGFVATQVDEGIIAVPDDAVSTLAGVSSVFVIEKAKVRQQAVTVGTRQGKLLEIRDGLKGNEVLAVSNLSQLATGVVVEVEPSSAGKERP
jgi:RND family efflux transporter MFP subunit